MLRAPGYYICEDAEYIKTISEVNKYVAKQIGIRQNKSRFPKMAKTEHVHPLGAV